MGHRHLQHLSIVHFVYSISYKCSYLICLLVSSWCCQIELFRWILCQSLPQSVSRSYHIHNYQLQIFSSFLYQTSYQTHKFHPLGVFGHWKLQMSFGTTLSHFQIFLFPPPQLFPVYWFHTHKTLPLLFTHTLVALTACQTLNFHFGSSHTGWRFQDFNGMSNSSGWRQNLSSQRLRTTGLTQEHANLLIPCSLP